MRYRNADFRAVPLSYDLILDQVVLYYPGQAASIKLVPEKISFFTLGSHQFVRLAALDSTAKSALPTGFYELLQEGPGSLLARRTKKVSQAFVQQNLTLEVKQTDVLFARSATNAAELTSLKNLVGVLLAHQAEVQRYARQQKLRFTATQREASALNARLLYRQPDRALPGSDPGPSQQRPAGQQLCA